MSKTRTVSKFIVALCPATPIYLAAPSRAPKGAITRVKDDACRFDTFDAAMEVAKDITGWGGAQRVEEIAVEIMDTRVTLDTPEARIEVRDTATAAFDGSQASSLFDKGSAVIKAMFDLGLQSAATASNFDASSPDRARSISVYLADHLGNLLTLDWDPMQDGFSYETEGDDACDIGETEAQHEAEPDHGCAGNCAPLSRKAARALRKWGNEKCKRAWHLNRLRGEGLTVCSVETGIPVRSVNSAIDAWQEVWEQSFDREPETATCDGCENAFPIDEVEVCGDAEHGAFGFCAACRAKSQDAPKAADPVTFDPAFLDGVLGRDDLTFDQTPLTAEQQQRARATLTAALRILVLDNLPRLASSALVEARENA